MLEWQWAQQEVCRSNKHIKHNRLISYVPGWKTDNHSISLRKWCLDPEVTAFTEEPLSTFYLAALIPLIPDPKVMPSQWVVWTAIPFPCRLAEAGHHCICHVHTVSSKRPAAPGAAEQRQGVNISTVHSGGICSTSGRCPAKTFLAGSLNLFCFSNAQFFLGFAVWPKIELIVRQKLKKSDRHHWQLYL